MYITYCIPVIFKEENRKKMLKIYETLVCLEELRLNSYSSKAKKSALKLWERTRPVIKGLPLYREWQWNSIVQIRLSTITIRIQEQSFANDHFPEFGIYAVCVHLQNVSVFFRWPVTRWTLSLNFWFRGSHRSRRMMLAFENTVYNVTLTWIYLYMNVCWFQMADLCETGLQLLK